MGGVCHTSVRRVKDGTDGRHQLRRAHTNVPVSSSMRNPARRDPGMKESGGIMPTRTNVGRFMGALIVTVTAAVVFAASPHYKRGGQPVCTVSGATVTCSTGTVAGLGNFDVVVSISFTASQNQLCHAPGASGQTAQGQNPATASGGSSLEISADQIKNGTLVVPAISATAAVTASSAEEAGCPNPNWTVTLDGPVTISGGVYTFESPPGTEIDKLSFTF
jgi:hypothetical protein